MAREEINFIRPQEIYDVGNKKSKVAYTGYDGKPHELEVAENLEGDVEDVINEAFVENDNNNVVFTDSNNNEHELVTAEGFLPAFKNAQMIVTTWSELKALRDGGQLVAGSLYRITDYNCTTTQENTQSAGHQFDIVLLALSENKLAEEGWAMEHPTDVYDVTFSDGVTKKCYLANEQDVDWGEGPVPVCDIIDTESLLGRPNVQKDYMTIDRENKAISFIPDSIYSTDLTEENLPYNYFQNSKLEAWKVWYCLDNDTARFAWADDSVDEDAPAFITLLGVKGETYTFYRDSADDLNNLFAWKEGDSKPGYTASQTPSVGDTIYDEDGTDTGDTVNSFTPAHEGTGLPLGRGVIYRLIDEFNNDIKCDFKNIQFKRKITDGQYDANGTETWCYTLNLWYNDMCQDASIVGNTLPNDEGWVDGVYDNTFGYTTASSLYIEGVNTFAFVLGDNVILSFDDYGYFGIYGNTIGNNFYGNTIGNNFGSNTIGNDCQSNTIGNNFGSNTIGNDCQSNTIGNDCQSNTIGNNFYGNTIGNDFYGNTIGNDCQSNTIGNNFYGNTIGNNFYGKSISTALSFANYGNNGVELATKE